MKIAVEPTVVDKEATPEPANIDEGDAVTGGESQEPNQESLETGEAQEESKHEDTVNEGDTLEATGQEEA